jgi:hypothetical protein
MGRTSSTSQGLFSVTVYKKRNADVAMRMELGAINLVGSDVDRAESLGRAPEVAGE